MSLGSYNRIYGRDPGWDFLGRVEQKFEDEDFAFVVSFAVLVG